MLTFFARRLILASICIPGLLSADLIVLRNGREYEGELVRADDTRVVFRTEQGEEVYARKEVVHVRLQQARRWSQYNRAGQIPDELLASCLARQVDPEQYPGAGTYDLCRSIRVKLSTARTWQVVDRRIVRILNEHGESASVRSITHRRDAEQADVAHAISIRPDGRVVHLRDTAIQSESIYGRYPRYDRLMRTRLALPEGKPGVVLDSEIVIRRFKPVPMSPFYREFLMGGVSPGAENKVAIWVPDDCQIQWQVVNDASQEVEHSERREDGGRWLIWRRSDFPLLAPEPLMAPWPDIIPRLIVSAVDSEEQDGRVDWAGPLEGGRLAGAAPACPQKESSPAELCNFVSRTIKDAGISLDATGRLPGDLAEAWRLRSASDLDRCALLCGWLNQRGFPARMVWVRPTQSGAPPTKFTPLGAFTIPAVYLPGGEPQFLLPGDQLSRADESAHALGGTVALAPGHKVIELPMGTPEGLGKSRHVDVIIDRKGNARVTDVLTYRGAACRSLRAWRELTGQERERKVEDLVAAQVPGAKSIDYEILGDVRKNKPTIALRMTYQVPDFADRRKSLTSVKMPWLEYRAWAVGRTDRKYDLYWGRPQHDTIQVSASAPAGWNLVAMPPARKASMPGLALEVEATESNESSACTVSYRREIRQAPVTRYPEFKKIVESRADTGTRYWVWEH